MKLLLTLHSGGDPLRVQRLLASHDAQGFTEIAHAHGRGASGRVEGTRAWPGETSVLFSIVPDERVAELQRALKGLAADAAPGERLHIAVLPVDHFF